MLTHRAAPCPTPPHPTPPHPAPLHRTPSHPTEPHPTPTHRTAPHTTYPNRVYPVLSCPIPSHPIPAYHVTSHHIPSHPIPSPLGLAQVLVQAAGGGVGTLAVQYASNVLGYGEVLGTSSRGNGAQLESLGLTSLIDYRSG